MSRALALACLLGAAGLARAVARPQERADFELTLVAANDEPGGRGAAQVFEYVARSTGTLHVWATSSELDPLLRIERADGTPLGEDEDSGGGTTAFVAGPVTAGEASRITVGAQGRGELGRVTVHVRELPETEATLAAAAHATAALDEARAALSAADAKRAREILLSELEALLAVNGISASRAAHLVLDQMSFSFDPGNFAEALRVTTALDRAIVDLYPAGCQFALVVRGMHAGVLRMSGRAEEALVQLRDVVLHLERLRGVDPLTLASAEQDLGHAYCATHDLERGVEWMARGVERLAAHLPANDLTLADARASLAWILGTLGEVGAARVAVEAAVAEYLEQRGPDDGDTLRLQYNLATLFYSLGDSEAALDLCRHVLAGQIALYGPEHEWVATTLTQVGVCLASLGETSEALDELVSAEHVLESIGSRPAGLAKVRHQQALIAIERGELELAREIVRRARGAEQTGNDWNLANIEARLAGAAGDHRAALAHAERALALLASATSDDRDRVEASVQAALAARRAGEPDRARELAFSVASALRVHFERTGALFAAREAAAGASFLAPLVSDVLALLLAEEGCKHAAEQDEAAFALVEAARGVAAAALATEGRARHAENAAGLDEARRDLRKWTREVARLARGGEPEELRSAVEAKERAERELRDLWSDGASSPSLPPVSSALPAIARALPQDGCAIGFWRYDPSELDTAGRSAREARLCAFVVRPDTSLQRVELGSCARVRAAVESWRTLVANGGTAAAPDPGLELARLVIEPLCAAIGDAQRWFVAQADALYSLPLDALPDPVRPGALLGDRVRITVVTALGDVARTSPPATARPRLVALGGVDFAPREAPAHGASPADGAPPPQSAVARLESSVLGDALRAGSSTGFATLEGTAAEARAVAALFEQRFGESGEIVLLEDERATRAALERELEAATFAHVATHGFFAASDAELAHSERLAVPGVLDLDVSQPRQGFTALARCGLALAGANRPAGPSGELDGVITAEELSGLDLSRCELVVLSACDTGTGYLRAGQGVSSFQKALHAAGARCVLTSLWKVGDLHTRELMLAFYRGVWVERLEPEEALWRAKRELRARRVAARDWAPWVLSRSGGG